MVCNAEGPFSLEVCKRTNTMHGSVNNCVGEEWPWQAAWRRSWCICCIGTHMWRFWTLRVVRFKIRAHIYLSSILSQLRIRASGFCNLWSLAQRGVCFSSNDQKSLWFSSRRRNCSLCCNSTLQQILYAAVLMKIAGCKISTLLLPSLINTFNQPLPVQQILTIDRSLLPHPSYRSKQREQISS
jgi:hypothetical protein